MKLNNTLKNIATTLGTFVSIVVAIWFFGQDSFNAKVNSLIKKYTEEQSYKATTKQLFDAYIKSPSFEIRLQQYLQQTNSNTVSLRALLASKLNIDEDEVATTLADLYLKDHKRLINLLRAVNAEFPEHNVWNID